MPLKALKSIQTKDYGQLESFNRFLSIAEELSSYLRNHEDIDVEAINDYQREFVTSQFLKLSLHEQSAKIKNFSNYYEMCRDVLNLKSTQSLKTGERKRENLKRFLKKYGLTLDDENTIFDLVNKDTYVEVYDNLFVQKWRSIDFYNVTTHTMTALETHEWFSLFDRSENLLEDQMSVVEKIYNESIQSPVYYPIDDHTVKEINVQSPRSSQAKILLYAPVYGVDRKFHGMLHLFKVLNTRSIDFKIL